MEERTNKSNTMLLTVIAIATLLVAVIGATFAYFTAQVNQAESTSTVIVEGVQLTITFADGTSDVTTNAGLTPIKAVSGVIAPAITKTFSISGINPTAMNNGSAGRAMPYTLYLIVTKNTFQLEETGGHTSLTYTLESSGAGAARAVDTKTDIHATTAATTDKGETWMSCPTGFTCGQTLLPGDITLHDNDGAAISGSTNLQGITLGTASFAAQNSKTPVTHTYTLRIYFDEINKNQDYDKNAEFTGYVAIDASGAITPNA